MQIVFFVKKCPRLNRSQHSDALNTYRRVLSQNYFLGRGRLHLNPSVTTVICNYCQSGHPPGLQLRQKPSARQAIHQRASFLLKLHGREKGLTNEQSSPLHGTLLGGLVGLVSLSTA